MNKQIELCNADLNKATFKNVMFLSFAEGGAMGCPGKIIFYVKTGECYSLNYVYGDAELDKVKELLLELKEKIEVNIMNIDINLINKIM